MCARRSHSFEIEIQFDDSTAEMPDSNDCSGQFMAVNRFSINSQFSKNGFLCRYSAFRLWEPKPSEMLEWLKMGENESTHYTLYSTQINSSGSAESEFPYTRSHLTQLTCKSNQFTCQRNMDGMFRALFDRCILCDLRSLKYVSAQNEIDEKFTGHLAMFVPVII